MPGPTKTFQPVDLFPLALVAANAQSKGAALDVSLLYETMLYIDFAPTGTGAVNNPTEIRLETSGRLPTGGTPNPDNSLWRPFATFYTNQTTSVSQAAGAGATLGATTHTQNPTAQYPNNTIIFYNNGTVLNSEWARVTAATLNTNITILDGLSFAQASSTIFTQAEQIQVYQDLASTKFIRAVVNNNRGTNSRQVAVRVALVTLDLLA